MVVNGRGIMEKEWHLAAQEHNKKTRANALNNVRVLSVDELSALHCATSLSLENLADSPYLRLVEEYEGFKAKIREIADSFTGRSSSPEDLKQVSKLLDNVLSALRAFDDRTKHALSQRYGKEGKEFNVFKVALSEEFDNNFAYRFSCQLRNYSQHTGSTVSNIQAGGGILYKTCKCKPNK